MVVVVLKKSRRLETPSANALCETNNINPNNNLFI
jgi:hypothetical protein